MSRLIARGWPVVVAALGLAGCAPIQQLAELAYQNVSTISVDLQHFDLELRGADATGVSGVFFGSPRDRVDHGLSGGELRIDVARRNLTVSVGPNRSRLELVVPRGTPVTISAGSGDVDLSGLAAPVSVSTGSGDVTVVGVDGEVQLSVEFPRFRRHPA